MDANGLIHFQIASGTDFGFARTGDDAPVNLAWEGITRALRLDRLQAAPQVSEDETFARAQTEKPSPVRDEQGSFAWWNPAEARIVAGGFAPGQTPLPVPPDDPPGVAQPTDMAFGEDDVLYIARNGGVVMVDRRERWAPAQVTLDDFDAHRLATAPDGGAWALDRGRGRIARLTGYPLRTSGLRNRDAEAFKPVEPNANPPRLRLTSRSRIAEPFQAMDIAVSTGGQVAVLAWEAADEAALFLLDAGVLRQAFRLEALRFPYALAWVGDAAVAVLASDGPAPAAQAFVYETDNATDADRRQRPLGATYRLLNPWHGPFLNGLAETPSHATTMDDPETLTGLRRLHPLSRAQYARVGAVTVGPFDCGDETAVWHRLYLEGRIPDQTGLRLWVHAGDTAITPALPGEDGAPDWALHRAGIAAHQDHPDAPRASWLDEASEQPFHPGLTHCAPEPSVAGLFTVLLQRPGRGVRRVRGRYLYLHIEMLGDGLATPEINAVRISPRRFSYRDQYLPEFYGETLSGADADLPAPATPPDFLDRFLHLFEGPLTQLEDKIAQSWLLTDPAATPDGALDWLGRWIGVTNETEAAPARVRQRLLAAPWTARLHGAMGGILAELEIATGGTVVMGGHIDRHGSVPRPGEIALASQSDGAIKALVLNAPDPDSGEPTVFLTGGSVTRGEIVAIEGFRLRRTFATILGADLADEDDPLVGTVSTSGNSFVGDTLILGDETRREFLALFAEDLPQTRRERAAVQAFFDGLAHRLLVLVRPSARTDDLPRLAEVTRAAAPAHVEVSIVPASRPLIVAAASLVGIDTFLLDEPQPGTVHLPGSVLGTGDQVRGAGQLDPRADRPIAAPPQAHAEAPAEVWSGSDFMLSAAQSRAADGRRIVRNIWMWN